MRRPGQIAAGTFLFFTPLHLPLGFRTVAWAAECLKVGVQAVGGAATVVYVVDFECCSCGVVVPTLGALVAVAVEYAASGCGGYVLGGVCPDHHSPFVLCALFRSRSGGLRLGCCSEFSMLD